MSLDMTDTIVPRSDQMNADDLMTGPRTFTISEVRKSSSPEQPVDVYLAEFPKGRPFKPSKSMRRIMVSAWGPEASVYVGHRLTLYRDLEVTFGKDKVGGVRISHMSNLPHGEPLKVALTVTRGKRAPYVVEPLPDTAQPSPVVSVETLAELRAMLQRKGISEEKWLAGAATAIVVNTLEQAQRGLAKLAQRPDAEPGPANEPTEDDLASWNAENGQ